MIYMDLSIKDIVRLNIIRLRAAKGWTQEELAHRMGTSFAHISQLETGVRGVGGKTEKKLLRAFGLDSPQELLRLPMELADPRLKELWENILTVSRGDKVEIILKFLEVIRKTESNELPDSFLKSLDSQLKGYLEIVK